MKICSQVFNSVSELLDFIKYLHDYCQLKQTSTNWKYILFTIEVLYHNLYHKFTLTVINHSQHSCQKNFLLITLLLFSSYVLCFLFVIIDFLLFNESLFIDKKSSMYKLSFAHNFSSANNSSSMQKTSSLI